MKILVTGFEPFAGESINPSQQVLRGLDTTIAGATIIPLTVPTVFDASITAVCEAIEVHEPDAVICLGQAGGRTAITPERVAINLNDARIPDNAGQQPIDTPVASGTDAPAAYFTTLPVKTMTAAIRNAGIPATLSTTAGTFVCNHLMYGVLHYIATTNRAHVRTGFIHIPYESSQARAHAACGPAGSRIEPFSLSLAELTRGITAALTALIQHEGEDLAHPEGSLH